MAQSFLLGMGYFNPHSRTESDRRVKMCVLKQQDFNPHSRTESDLQTDQTFSAIREFQSTLSHGE